MDYDRGIERGISTLDGKPNVIQCKFKNSTKYLTNEDNISNVLNWIFMNEGLYNGKNVIIVTSCKGVHLNMLLWQCSHYWLPKTVSSC